MTALETTYVDIISNSDVAKRDIQKDMDDAFKSVEKSSEETTKEVTRDFRQMAGEAEKSFTVIDKRFRDTEAGFANMSRAASTSLENTAQETASVAERAAQDFASFFSSIKNAIGDIGGSAKGVEESLASVGDEGEQAFKRVGESADSATKAAKGFSVSFSSLPRLISSLASSGPAGIAILAAGFTALIGIVAAAAQGIQDLIAIIQFAGALAPGLFVGAIATFGILATALHGVGDAYTEQTKKASKAGAAGVSNARQVADAQRAVIQAEKDLIKARDEELKRIRDIGIESQRARATEARAADEVLKAQFALDQARKTGTPRSQIEAQLALDEANASLTEAQAKTKDLAKEKAKADKVGVEGSDQVLRAQEALRDAQDRLAASQQRYGAAVAKTNVEFDKLSKNAQAFVLSMISARNQLEPVRKAIQDAFFQGNASKLQPIVDNLKDLQPELTIIAGDFGAIFGKILDFLGSKEFKTGFDKVLSGLNDFLTAITPSIQPLLTAFIGLAGKSDKFGKTLGEKVATALGKIADFVTKVDIQKLFDDASAAVKELIPFLQAAYKIFKGLFDILVPLGRITFPSIIFYLTLFGEILIGLGIASKAVFGTIETFAKSIGEQLGKLNDPIKKALGSFKDFFGDLGTKFKNGGKNLITQFFQGMSDAGGGVSGFANGLAKSVGNALIKFINNNVIGGLNKAVKFVADGLSFIPGAGKLLPDIPKIPLLEAGGLVTSPTLAGLGERGRKEAVLPLENRSTMAAIGAAIASATRAPEPSAPTFGAGSFILNFNGSNPSQQEAFAIGRGLGEGIQSVMAQRSVKTQIRTF
jgi:hypothetical protein